MQTGIKPLGRERWWLFLLLAPTLLGLLFGAFGSVAASVVISLTNWDLLTPPEWAGLQNYLDLAGDRMFLKSMRITTQFAAMYVPGVIILSLIVALLLNRRIRGVSFFRVAFFLPVISSSVAVGLLWTWIYAQDNGLLNYLITAFGGENVRWLGRDLALYSVTVVNIWGAVGEGMIIFLAGLQAVPRDYYEAAKLDGATGWQRLTNITLPLIVPEHLFSGGYLDHQRVSGVRVHLYLDADLERRLYNPDDGLYDLPQRLQLFPYGSGERAGDCPGCHYLRPDAPLLPHSAALGGVT